jgi:hypothetical protein
VGLISPQDHRSRRVAHSCQQEKRRAGGVGWIGAGAGDYRCYALCLPNFPCFDCRLPESDVHEPQIIAAPNTPVAATSTHLRFVRPRNANTG